jgi:hypothetical protein
MDVIQHLKASALADQRHYDSLWRLTGCEKWRVKAQWARSCFLAYSNLKVRAHA